MRFESPAFLFLLLLLPLVGYLSWRRRGAGLHYSSLTLLAHLPRSRRSRFARIIPLALRLLALALIIIAIARPVTVDREGREFIEGIDIVLAIDCSSSMTAQDLGDQSRLDYAREVIKEFIRKRPDDRIGLVVFSGRAFTQAPLTIDHDILFSLLDQIKTGMIEDGTAIGMALGTAVNRLKDSRARSKVVILLTDGENNAGVIDPLTAAQLSQTYGIKVYTIGVGSPDGYRFRQVDPRTGQIFTGVYRFNPDLLRQIARITTGSEQNYYQATSVQELEQIYEHINQLEKTELEVTHIEKKTEAFAGFALAALLFFLLEVTLRQTVLRRIPV